MLYELLIFAKIIMPPNRFAEGKRGVSEVEKSIGDGLGLGF